MILTRNKLSNTSRIVRNTSFFAQNIRQMGVTQSREDDPIRIAASPPSHSDSAIQTSFHRMARKNAYICATYDPKYERICIRDRNYSYKESRATFAQYIDIISQRTIAASRELPITITSCTHSCDHLFAEPSQIIAQNLANSSIRIIAFIPLSMIHIANPRYSECIINISSDTYIPQLPHSSRYILLDKDANNSRASWSTFSPLALEAIAQQIHSHIIPSDALIVLPRAFSPQNLARNVFYADYNF